MFDVKKIEETARLELAKEQGEKAKTQIKSQLQKIAAARSVVSNLERDYEVLLREIGA